MENQEEVLQSLEDFAKMKPKEIPKELEDYLEYVAKTGDPVYQWSAVKCLFREKLLKVITDFYESCPTCPNNEFTPCPNVEPFNYENMKSSLLERLDSFSSAPFTIQRLSELITTPTKEYTRVDKFMRAVEKNILVVSTKEPGNCRRSDVQSEFLMNGVMDGRTLDISEAIETVSSDGVGLLQSDESDVTVSNGLRIDELDMENRSDVENTNATVWNKDRKEDATTEKQSIKVSDKNCQIETENETVRVSPEASTGRGDVEDETGEHQHSFDGIKEKAESEQSSAVHKIAENHEGNDTPVASVEKVSHNDPLNETTENISGRCIESVQVEEVSSNEEREDELAVSSAGIVLEADENVPEVSACAEEDDDELSNDSYSPTQPVESILSSPPRVAISEIGTEGESVDSGAATIVVAPAIVEGGSATPGAAVEEVIVAASVTDVTAADTSGDVSAVEKVAPTTLVTQQDGSPSTKAPLTEELENAMVSEVVETVESVKVLAVEDVQPQSHLSSAQRENPQQPTGCDESMEVDEQLQLQEEMSMDGDEPMDQTEEMNGVDS